MNLKVAICDDDNMTLETIPGAIIGNFKYNGIDAVVDKYNSPSRLYNNLDKNYNIFFLDIDMPELDGISLAERIVKQNAKATIIFVSGREERVFDALTVHPFGFVRKSHFIEDLSKITKQYASQLLKDEDSQSYINVEVKNSIRRIEISDIIYIESYKDIKSIYIKGEKDPLDVRLTMEYFEEKLIPFGFYRIHKGYIINLSHVIRVDSGDVTMDNKAKLPVSRRRLQETRQQYLKYSRK